MCTDHQMVAVVGLYILFYSFSGGGESKTFTCRPFVCAKTVLFRFQENDSNIGITTAFSLLALIVLFVKETTPCSLISVRIRVTTRSSNRLLANSNSSFSYCLLSATKNSVFDTRLIFNTLTKPTFSIE